MNREQSGVLYLVAAFVIALLWARGYLSGILTQATGALTSPPERRPLNIGAASSRAGWSIPSWSARFA